MQSTPRFNDQIKQVMILMLLLLMVYLVIKELYVFLPGLLGALTLYILSRASYFQLVYYRKWRKGWTAGLFMLGFMLLMGLLVYFTITLLEQKVAPFFDNPASSLNQAKDAIIDVQKKTGFSIISDETLANFQQKIAAFIPSLLNDTINLITNLIILLFVLYYMLVHAKEMESYLGSILPLKQTNIDLLAKETKKLVRASALGIPMISIIQGLTATLGYVIFRVDEFVLWGFFTGVFAFFPVVGTMIIWVPLVIYMYASGNTMNAVGLAIYSIAVTGNVDYIARISLLKKWGNIHPMVTVLGVIAGLGLFGFIGLIFGPLLVNYIILLFKIYSNEFLEPKQAS
ncbi:MAG: AI-2E family transporter [Chitinophagaceae bacterium]